MKEKEENRLKNIIQQVYILCVLKRIRQKKTQIKISGS